MKLIWATRGLTWGFRFLDDGGFPDPLVVYDRFFKGVGDQPEVWRAETAGEPIALRFPDPLGRRDDAGRVIPHEFVVFRPDVEIDSFEECRDRVWDQVKDRFEGLWDGPDPYIAPK
jgi:hypothetical protein